jgi:catechol 2,3-dioxygenase-like lactoylglutathione lyase family enzyme
MGRSGAMRLEHVNLTVTDVDRSTRFYQDLFDFKVRWQGSTGGGTPAVHIGGDSFYLALFETDRAGRAPYDYGAVGVNHFGFVVDDLDEIVRRLDAQDIECHLTADYEPGRRAYFFDPDGHEIEVVEYAGPSDFSPTAA